MRMFERSLMAGIVVTVRAVLAASRFTRPERLAAWSVLKPRRFDPALSARVLTLVARDGTHADDSVGRLGHLTGRVE